MLVFGREGYSSGFFKELWQSHRIACITYHKFPRLNPDGLVRSLQGKLNRQQCLFAAHTIRPETELDEVPKWESRNRELKEHLESLEQELERDKQQRKETPHHLKWEELPEPSKFERLSRDLERGELRVTVHPLSNPRSNRAVSELLNVFNATETNYPGTKLKLTYALIGSQEFQKPPT